MAKDNKNKKEKRTVYFTLTGTNYFCGQAFLESGMEVILKKEPDNKQDKEAIAVKLEGLGRMGYVANSPHTVKGESYSAGRIYDLFDDEAKATVKYVLDYGAICSMEV